MATAMMIIGGQAVMADAGPIEVLDTIQGRSFLAIQAAMDVFQRRHPDLRRYRIDVVRDASSEVVAFTERDGKAGAPVEVGVRPGAGAELAARDLEVLRMNSDRVTPVDSVQGGNVLAIQAAMNAFQVQNPDLKQYKIDVVRDGNSVVVIFADKDRQPGTKGSLGPRPGFEVELNPDDLQVRRANFIR